MSTAISEQINRIETAKTDISNAVAAKGVIIPAGTPIDEYAAYIAQINTGISMDDAHPVGSLYLSYNSTSPAQLFGGQWVQIYDRFLLAVGYNYVGGATGGSATVTLTSSQIPGHSHAAGETNVKYLTIDNSGSPWKIPITSGSVSGDSYDGAGFTTSTGVAGGNQSHSNMPPYLAVYMWRRKS